LGIPDNGVFETPIREIVPLESRNKASDNAWSSCTSCHPDGLSDGVTELCTGLMIFRFTLLPAKEKKETPKKKAKEKKDRKWE